MKNRLSIPLIPMVINLSLSLAEMIWLMAKCNGIDTAVLVFLMITKGMCWLFILGQLKITPIHWSEE